LAADTWYFVSTAVNNREPLFWSTQERVRFEQVLSKVREVHVFELRRLRFEGPQVSFCIKPTDGFMLPFIMQWLKQTFAGRYNVMKHLDGHVWGDRYWSMVLEEEPFEEGILTGKPVCGECGENARDGSATDWEAEGQTAEAHPRSGPPGGGGSPRESPQFRENTRKPASTDLLFVSIGIVAILIDTTGTLRGIVPVEEGWQHSCRNFPLPNLHLYVEPVPLYGKIRQVKRQSSTRIRLKFVTIYF
jgi:hypothetical protein